jgi:hypothetical protein
MAVGGAARNDGAIAGAREVDAPRQRPTTTQEAAMRISLKGKNPFGFLFVRTRREQYLTQYVVREYGRGRSLEDVLADPYVRNRSTPEERARLLERPELVAAIGEQAVADLRLALATAPIK